MIKLFVEGREIALPSDISFEFTSENRLFSNADGYSFDIEIPLKESAVNSEVFRIVSPGYYAGYSRNSVC